MWEVPLTDIQTMEKEYDIGIVLGGFSKDNIKPFDRLHFTASATRVTTAVELYQAGKIKKILITGGSIFLKEGELPEGKRTQLFLEKMGIPPEDIIIESESLNTRENATLTKKIIDEGYPNSSCLLITSAFHMKRAKKCFEKVDLNCDTFSTAPFSARLNRQVYYYCFPNGSVLEGWQILIKEWVGYVMYKMVGYI
ncbi:MAG: YdcF family protein [Saprospiraceae bacterium]